jgi:hypothetical protein
MREAHAISRHASVAGQIAIIAGTKTSVPNAITSSHATA